MMIQPSSIHISVNKSHTLSLAVFLQKSLFFINYKKCYSMSTHIGAKMKEKNVVTIYLFHVNLTIALYRQVDVFPKLYQVFLFYILWGTCDST